MKKAILLIIATVLNVGPVFPQCYFYETYDYDTKHDHATSILETSNGGFLSVGNAEIVANNEEGTYTLITDNCGDGLQQLFNILSPASGGERPWAIFQNNTSLFLFGEMHDNSEGANSCFILKLGANGDSIYHKVINHGYNDVCKSALKLNDNAFILGGYYNLSPPDKLIFLSKVDSMGNIIWQHDYGNPTDGYRLKNIDKTHDGGYIMGGSLNYGPSGYPQKLYLIKIDSAGNKEWEKHYNNTFYQGYVLATRDGGYLLVGNNRPSQNNYNGYVGKMDSSGNVEWDKRFDQPGDPNTFINALQTEDGNYLITGTLPNDSGGIDTYLGKISQTNGNVIWERTYNYFGGQAHSYMLDMIITEQGDIAGTGYTIPSGVPNNTGNDMFILKVDSCGYLENDSIQANFSFSKDSTGTVAFTNQSAEYCTSYWRFGNGDSSNTTSPTHEYSDTGVYTLTLIVRAGNSLDTVQKQVNIQEIKEDTVGVGRRHLAGSIGQPGVRVYPNPASEVLHVQSLKLNGQLSQIRIFDIQGRTLKSISNQQPSTKSTVNINELSQGIYFYRVQLSSGGIARGKFVVR